MGDTKPARHRTIELLCQDCHGTLTASSINLDTPEGAHAVWICRDCRHTWVYMQRGWVRQDY